VMILWAWTALLSGVALLPTYTNRGNAMVPFLLGALALVLYILFHPGVRSARGLAVRARHPAASLNRADDPGAEDADADGSGPDAVVHLAHHRRKRA
jgi:hypothetical protein